MMIVMMIAMMIMIAMLTIIIMMIVMMMIVMMKIVMMMMMIVVVLRASVKCIGYIFFPRPGIPSLQSISHWDTKVAYVDRYLIFIPKRRQFVITII